MSEWGRGYSLIWLYHKAGAAKVVLRHFAFILRLYKHGVAVGDGSVGEESSR